MNYVPLDSVVAEALLVIGADQDTELMKNICRQWIWRFKQELPVTEDEIVVCNIYPKNLIIKKPADMRRHLEMAFYNSEGLYIPAVFHADDKRIYPQVQRASATNLTPEQIDQLEQFLPVDYSEDQFAFYLGSNGTHVAYAKVRYYAYPLDKDGMPLISEDEVLGCIYFCRFMNSLRKDDNRSGIQQNELLYKQESDRLRAKKKAATLNNDEATTVAKIRAKMVPNFTFKRF